MAVDNFYEYTGWPGSATYLHFGFFKNGDLSNQHPGIKIFLTIDKPWVGGGTYFTTQLFVSTKTDACGAGGVGHYSGSGLDTGINTLSYSSANGYYLDDPGTDCSGNYHIRRSDSFQTTLMFDPQTGSSIAVPLKLVEWFWKGEADATGGWHLSSSDHDVTANNQNTTTFPFWTNTISGTDGQTYIIDGNCP